MTRLETLKAETAQTVVEQRVTHHRDTQHLRAENTQLTQRCAQLERRVGALEEGAAAAGKREEKYREDADHDYFQNQTLAQGLAHYKSLNARSQQIYVEKAQLEMDLAEAKKLIDRMSINADGAVPRADYEVLKQQSAKLEAKVVSQQREAEKAERKLGAAAAKLTSLTQRNESLQAKINELREVGTPRPSREMEELLAVLGSSRTSLGPERGATTISTTAAILEKVTHVVNKLNEARAVAPNNEPYHLGLGNGDGVPAYLRTEEVGVRIRNRRMPKRDVEYFVGQLFKRKVADDHQRDAKSPKLAHLTMQEFVHQHLVKEYIHPGMVAEVAYNLLDGCKRYFHDADIELFSKVMSGLLSEQVVKMQAKMLAHIKKELETMSTDETTGKPRKGVPSKAQVIACVQAECPFYSDEGYSRISEALDLDVGKAKGAVNWQRLFTEDGEGNQLSFVEALRDEQLHDREAYFEELEHAICDQDPEHDGLVHCGQIMSAIKAIDPQKTEEQAKALVRLGLMVEKKEPETGVVVGRELIHPLQELPHESILFSTAEFMKLVRTHAVERHSKPQFADGEEGQGEEEA